MPSASTAYSSDFFASQEAGSTRSALHIAPILMELIAPASVVDVGCGVGTWLKAFMDQGVEKIFGLDGDYVDRQSLQISPDHFQGHDLTNPLPQMPTFDLALSVEVAEHLPPERAASFVHELTSLAPVVCFSAAVPFQGGVEHLNEQWQDWWAEHFKSMTIYR